MADIVEKLGAVNLLAPPALAGPVHRARGAVWSFGKNAMRARATR